MNYLSNCDRFGSVLGNAAAFFREIALEIDMQPDSIVKYKNHIAITNLVFGEKQNCFARVKAYEALAYGDAGVLLACPGASLAGVMIDELGNEEQRNIFYQHIHSEKARTFLAVTEPESGSNLNNLQTHIQLDPSLSHQWILNGEKWLVGHGATGSIGVVIVKTHAGPLGVRAVMTTPTQLSHTHSVNRSVLPMVGLKGARLGRLIFKNHFVPAECLLGSHLSAVEHGMMALIKTFNHMRPCVGALAVGTAQAFIDYLYTSSFPLNTSNKNKLKFLNYTIGISRELLYWAAKNVEQDPYKNSLSSLAKEKAVRTAENVANAVLTMLKQYHFMKYPFLEKWYRDVWGFEYMEGTQHVHKKNVFNAYRCGKLKFDLEDT